MYVYILPSYLAPRPEYELTGTLPDLICPDASFPDEIIPSIYIIMVQKDQKCGSRNERNYSLIAVYLNISIDGQIIETTDQYILLSKKKELISI